MNIFYKIVTFIFFALITTTLSAQVIKGAGVWYFTNLPNVTPNTSTGTELAFSVSLKKLYRWNRTSSAWDEIKNRQYLSTQNVNIGASQIYDSLSIYNELIIAMDLTSAALGNRISQLPGEAVLGDLDLGKTVTIASNDSSGLYYNYVASGDFEGLIVADTLTTSYELQPGEVTIFQYYKFGSVEKWKLISTTENTGGGGSGSTDLAYTASPTNGVVTSNTGTDATIPLADDTNAGLVTPTQATQLGRVDTLPEGEIWIGNTSDEPQGRVMNGDVFIDYLGNTTIQNNKITAAMIVNGTILWEDLSTPAKDSISALIAANTGADSISILQDSIIVLYASGVEVSRDTIGYPAGGGGANLTYTASPTNGVVDSDSGTDATIPMVDGTNAGLMPPASKAKLDTLPYRLDISQLYEIKEKQVATGVAANESVANYSFTSVDINPYKLSTRRFGYSFAPSGTEYGGWLANGTSGDSIKVTAPFGVVIGDSQAQGNPGRRGRMNTYGGVVDLNYPDSVGQLSYHLAQLTKMRWYNQGIGNQTSTQIRARFARDVLGEVSNPSDGRGTQTLFRKPYAVVIVIGINDAFVATPNLQVTKDNFEWMAARCNDYNIKCIVLNLPGDSIINQTQSAFVENINDWLAKGALNPYGAVVVDYNKWWRNPTYNNNYNPNTTYIVDDIHPSLVGYDSLSSYIFREAKLPVLTKLIVNTERDPTGFTGFSRPADITINGVSGYNINADIDTLSITNYIPDSVWIKINSSTNVTGTTYSGFSHLEWVLENSGSDERFYTKRTATMPGSKVRQIVEELEILSGDYSSKKRLNMMFPDRSRAFEVEVGGGVVVSIGAGTGLSGVLRAYGNVGVSGLITATANTGLGHILGNFQIGSTARPIATGYGIGVSSSNISIETTGGFYFRRWEDSPVNISGSNQVKRYFRTEYRAGTFNYPANNDSLFIQSYTSVINDTSTFGTHTIIEHYMEPTITNLGTGTKYYNIVQKVGINLFNKYGGNTGIGLTSIDPSARLHLAAGTATAGTAPLKFTSGTNLTTPEAGAVEFDGTDLFYTTSTPTRRTVANLAGTQTLTNKTISGASNTITNVSAANVVNTPSGNLAASDQQAANNELQSDIDTRAPNTITDANSNITATTVTTAFDELSLRTVTSNTSNLTITPTDVTSTNGVQAYRFGDMVHIHGVLNFTGTVTLASLTDVFQLPVGFRPAGTISGTCLAESSDGVITIAFLLASDGTIDFFGVHSATGNFENADFIYVSSIVFNVNAQ